MYPRSLPIHNPSLALLLGSASLMLASFSMAQELPVVTVEAQPLGAQATRVIQALDYLGQPLSTEEKETIASAIGNVDETATAETIQQTLDSHCLAVININPESRVKVARGPAAATLVEQGWTAFLVKVHNEAGVTAALRGKSPNAASTFNSPKEALRDRWMDLAMFDKQPLTKTLSGLACEYRLIQLYSRDAGKREAKLVFDVGQGTQDLGFRNEIDILFDCQPAHEIALKVLDENNKPTTAAFEFRDQFGRVYPAQSKRAAPDFAFHPQVYRMDGERIHLPLGKYEAHFSRGPESIPQNWILDITPETKELAFKVERWIDPSLTGWWSGDHHIHAAGCAHYTAPSEGVHAPDMMRHCLGEDLKIGCNLTWGPCFDYQKQFFTGKNDKVSQYPYLLRYDVEVSGFGSHQSGHLCLLRLKEQMYPGGDSMHHWPTLCLNTLRWAKKQGALVGPAHSGWGLQVDTEELPNFIVPPYDGIGANEYIVDVTHTVPGPDGSLVPAVDFMSMVDTPYVWELNMWYHTLNAGFRTRISGETDFPCIYGERVGLGRSYVKLGDKLDYDAWCEGIREGRNYAGDGNSHLLEFQVDDVKMGENGSELKLDAARKVKVRLQAAAMLELEPREDIRRRSYTEHPYWHVEHARIGNTRTVAVEILQNGYPVATREILADGSVHDLEFDIEVSRSSWIAARILRSSHTNPVFVIVEEKPIRAFRSSIDWCLKGVDQCWKNKEAFISPKEIEQAKADYQHAREVYTQRLAECEWD
ncbi:MAG: CehA/McbA family metallohydrolase [Verrucomicrobiales bacterium]